MSMRTHAYTQVDISTSVISLYQHERFGVFQGIVSTVSFPLPGLLAYSRHHGEVCEPAEKGLHFRRSQPLRAQSELQVALLVVFVTGEWGESPPREEQGAGSREPASSPDRLGDRARPASRRELRGELRWSPPTGTGRQSLHRRKKVFRVSLQRLQSQLEGRGSTPALTL